MGATEELPLSYLFCLRPTFHMALEKWGHGDLGFCLFSGILSSPLCTRHCARGSDCDSEPEGILSGPEADWDPGMGQCPVGLPTKSWRD